MRLNGEKERVTNIQERYELAKEIHAGLGVDVDAAAGRLNHIPASTHCWQGDGVVGFGGADNLSDDIQATGNYPGKTRDPQELVIDINKALNLIPGRYRINLHVSYAIFQDGERVDRDVLEPRHLADWVKFAKGRGLGLGFNPIMFLYPKAENATLSGGDSRIRKFWTDHCRACVCISQYFVGELGSPYATDIWISDGFKDIPTDRMSPRARLKDSLDQILAMDYDKSKMSIAVESKVFGIGMESCTVGSREFYMSYAASGGIMYLLGSGHFHPTEMISDKISSTLLFSDKIALHVSRPVRWGSDYVMLFDDETREIAKKIVRGDPNRVFLAPGFFDASINRICVWVVGMRNIQKALLYTLPTPNEELVELREERRFTELMMEQEKLKTYPLGNVWGYFYQMNQVPMEERWSKEARAYEEEVLLKRS